MTLGIVILNWNGKSLLERFLPDLIKYSKKHHLYVADNASTDSSVAFVKKNFPEVTVISMSENLGYAGGYNTALEQVDEDVFCLLNNDVKVTAGWCDGIMSRFQEDPDLGVLQPKIKDLNRPAYFEYAGAAGGYIDRYAYPYCRGRIFNTIEEDSGQYDTAVTIDWASGACLFIRRELFYEAGQMDKNYFAHQEEIDLCWRVRHLGYKISVVPSSKVFHLGGATLSNTNPRKTFYNFRNSLFNIIKNDYSRFWWLKLFMRMVLDGIAGLKFLFEFKAAHFAAILRAHFSFYGQVRSMWSSRLKFKKKNGFINTPSRRISIVSQYFIYKNKTYVNLRKSVQNLVK
jgi:hypothetical protein